MLDSVGQAGDAIDESMLVNHVNNYASFSIANSNMRTVLIENGLAYSPEDFIVQQQSIASPYRNDNFRAESESQG